MAVAILETSVAVDLLRNYPPAIHWYAARTQADLAITPMVWMEVISGGQSKLERVRIAKFLSQFEMIYLDDSDLRWAMEAQMQYELSHGVGAMDCLIASVCHRLQLPLYTHNLKHYVPILGALSQKPY